MVERDKGAGPGDSGIDDSERTVEMSADEGSIYPDFVIKGELGRGGFGRVHLARETSARRDVALKAADPMRGKLDARRLARFMEEAYITAQLQHPGIVPVYRINEGASGLPFYTMRPIEGETLKAILDKLRGGDREAAEQFSLRRLVQIFQSVCQTIRFAHDRGVLHRDLKPANIVVGEYGEVLVIDWGMAKVDDKVTRGQAARDAGAAEDKRSVWRLYERRIVSLRTETDSSFEVTTEGTLMGTPAYMSPEQASGSMSTVSMGSDIWSLGAILYEICALRRPFEGLTVKEVLLKVQTEEPVNPARMSPQRKVPEDLAAIAMKCLKREVKQRFGTVGELLSDVTAWLEGVTPWRTVLDVDFSTMPDGEVEGWEQVQENNSAGTGWRVRGGELQHDGVDHSLLLPCGARGDVRVEMEAMVEAGSEAEVSVSLCFPGSHHENEGYMIQWGRESNTTSRIVRKGAEVASIRSGIATGQWHLVVSELAGNMVRLIVDGREVTSWQDESPLRGGSIGLYGWGAGPRIRRLRLMSRGMPLLVSCMERGKALLEAGLFERARAEYLEVATDHPTREEGLRSRFQAGSCSVKLARSADAAGGDKQKFLEDAWASFEELEGSYLAPLACLGKSFVHEVSGRSRDEAGELERAFKEYPGHASLRVIGERVWERATQLAWVEDRPRAGIFAAVGVRHCREQMKGYQSVRAVACLADIKLAIEVIRESAARESDASWDLRRVLAGTLMWDRQHGEAIAVLREGLATKSRELRALILTDLGLCLGTAGELDQALSHLRQAIALAHEPLNILLAMRLVADVHLIRGEHQAARAACAEAANLHGRNRLGASEIMTVLVVTSICEGKYAGPVDHSLQVIMGLGNSVSSDSEAFGAPVFALDIVKSIDIAGVPGQGSATITTVDNTYTAIPEPASLALVGLGGAALLTRRRRK